MRSTIIKIINKKMKIAVIARFANQLSVWGAMKSHIELMLTAGYEVVILVENGCEDIVLQTGYANNTKIYKTKNELRRLLAEGNHDAVWCGDIFSVLLIKSLRPLSKKPIFFWVQGTLPDESYLRNKSKIRRTVLRFLERAAFKITSGYIYVSDAMKDFYEKKYAVGDRRSIIVPCLSEFDSFNPNEIKKIEHSFVYVGGISEWQCFDEIVRLYKSIMTTETVFHVITLDINKANLILRKYGIDENAKVYSIHDRTQIPPTLAQFQYGFLIRKESPVNYVASPIKFLEYLSCNVNVIMTKAVPSYSRIVDKYKIGSVVEPNETNAIIRPYNNQAREVYLKHFSREQYKEIYKELYEKD